MGFLRYWTPNNIPNFALASPMLVILAYSGFSALSSLPFLAPSASVPLRVRRQSSESEPSAARQLRELRQCAAAVQLLLAAAALTSYHVQIITRLSSAYPVWYWWLADRLLDGAGREGGDRPGKGRGREGEEGFEAATSNQLRKTRPKPRGHRASSRWGVGVVTFSIMYSCIQASMFAFFLPPA